MKDNVFAFRKPTLMYLGIKGYHVSNLNTVEMVQEKYVYAERRNYKANRV